MINYFDDCSVWMKGLFGDKTYFYSEDEKICEFENCIGQKPKSMNQWEAREVAQKLFEKFTWIYNIKVEINSPTQKIFTILAEYAEYAKDFNSKSSEK